jgi:hypothetical protein
MVKMWINLRQHRRETNYEILFFALSCYAINRFLLKNVISVPVIGYFLRCYFNDVLCGICIISYINIVLLTSIYDIFIHNYSSAIAISFCTGLLWEYIFPLIYNKGTSDFLDVISYCAGGAIYIAIAKQMSSSG